MFSVLHREKRTRVQRKVGLRCGLVLVDPRTSTAKTGKEHLHEYHYKSAVPYDSYYSTPGLSAAGWGSSRMKTLL